MSAAASRQEEKMLRVLALALLAAAGAQPAAQEVEHYRLLKQLRRQGFTCPNGQSFPPNAGLFAFDCRAWKAARAHSADMASRSYFSHVTPEGLDPCARTRAAGLQACSENLAAGQATAQSALDAFKASANHCPNMMDPSLNRVGIGYANAGASQYKHYWTQAMGSDDGAIDVSCSPPDAGENPKGQGAASSCRDFNPNCARFQGYAGTPHCQTEWTRTQCPKTCGHCS
jgi:hypothetical protein